MQKNSGNKGAKRRNDIGASAKNKKEVLRVFDFIKDQGNDDPIMKAGTYIAKVIRKLGNGQVLIFFVDETDKPIETRAIIRGSFRGRGKRDVWIDIGSIVVVEENINVYEIIALLTREQIKNLAENVFIDDRIYSDDPVDDLFDVDEEETDENGNTDKRKKRKHARENIPLEDADIDKI
jgi:hypothetical protein